MQTKKQPASTLAVTVIILGLILTIALGASAVSIMEKKTSLGANKSNIAYQKADTGIERVLWEISNHEGGIISDIDGIDDCGDSDGARVISEEDDYEVTLKNKDGNNITDCSADIASVRWLKSIGTAGQNQRVVEVAVAAEGAYQVACAYKSETVCCKIRTIDGDTECRYSNDKGANWSATDTNPFGSGSDSKYSLTGSAGDDSGVIFCKTDMSNGETDCQYTSDKGSNWSDAGSDIFNN